MIDTESGKAQTLRFAIDLIVRLTLLAGIVYVSVLLLSPIAGMLLWSAIDRKSTRLNSSHSKQSRMPSSA